MMLSAPEGIEKLKNYSMWQAFLHRTLVYLGKESLTLYEIQFLIIRAELPRPNITEFILGLANQNA